MVEEEPEPEPELVRGVIEESFVGAPAVPYSVDLVVAGDVKVYFNNGTSGFIVAIFHGSGMTDPTGLCPGSSLFAGSFQFVSNAPAAVDACDGFTTDVSSVRVCTSAVWLLQTKIPNDSVGDVYGSLEKIVDGDFVGMTAVATNSPGTPPIDFDADVHTIPSMFTIDGAAEISCDAALT